VVVVEFSAPVGEDLPFECIPHFTEVLVVHSRALGGQADIYVEPLDEHPSAEGSALPVLESSGDVAVLMRDLPVIRGECAARRGVLVPPL